MLIEITKSKLVKRIYDQSKPQKADAKYNFYSLIDRFANHVIPQLTQINLLFDEYTPHDQIHMESLFNITDELLGSNIIENLNGCEACILACAIYGHDWGMAISEDEKELIVTGNIPKERKVGEFALLCDEKILWKKYASSKKLNIDESGYVKLREDVSKEIWREYVRETHAERAKVRTIHFFSGDDDTFGKTLGEVCAGHWYPITQIAQLSKNKLVQDSTVNMQALTTYMRFVDLLDVGKNRTPYSLWKFVNPKNIFSANEWKKHRSLEPVSFLHNNTEDNSKKILKIIVQGSTDNHIVYSSLKDMQNWVQTQVKENEQVLKELGKYSLGAIKLEWHIEPEGFDPIDIRFEFDRSKMFDLISGEIYNGDPYVFLRELLQNSIDATKVRELQYTEKGTSINLDKLTIRVDVTHKENGDSIIIFSDSGTGMNLNVIRNYLSVIGQSYYRSDDFNNMDLELNPISRFGVGLISCFEIADTISIRTQTDRYINEETETLQIEIEHYNQQFRVKKLHKNSINTGTSITVNVLGEKWKKDTFKNDTNLKVTEYLKSIAGFVPYPILITEVGTKTLIISAELDSKKTETIAAFFPNSVIWKEQLSLPLINSIIHEDLGNATYIFEEKTTLFSKIVEGHNVTGAFSYFIPKKNLIGIQRKVNGSSQGVTAFLESDNALVSMPIRYKPHGPNIILERISKSSKKSNYKKLYLNGILIPDIEENLLDFNNTYLPPSRTTININPSKEKVIITDLSRKEIHGTEKILNEILTPLFKSEFHTLFKGYEQELKDSNLLARLFLLSRLNLYFPKASLYLKDFYPIRHWPIPYINHAGKIELLEVQNLPDKIELLPKKFMQDSKDIFLSWSMKSYLDKTYAHVLPLFNLTSDKIYIKDFGFEYDDGSAMEWNSISDLITHNILSENYTLKELRIAKLNGVDYIIENWTKGQQVAKEKENIHMYSFKFIPFDQESNSIFCLLPLENSQISQNCAGKMIFNLNHPATILLEKALNTYNKNVLTLQEPAKEKLNTAFLLNPLIGYRSDNYSGNSLQIKIAEWVKTFCNSLDQHHLISLTIEDKLTLQKKLKIHTCLE